MVLAGVLYAGIAAKTLYTNEKRKSLQLELSDKIKAKIQDEGLYHVTTREAAEAIIESGFLLPTRGLADNHFAKERYGDDFADFVYMFAGKPSVEMYKNNLSHQMTKDGSIYAI